MCRLFSQISPKVASAKDYLAESGRSLLIQSDILESNLQKDGWGIGHINGSGAKVVKSAGAAFDEKSRFKAAADTQGTVVMGHLRAASNPLGLPRKKLLRRENAQPFTDGRFVFIHNGTVEIPIEVRRFLGPYRDRVKGENDSEVFFWQFRKFYDLYQDVPKALQACIDELFGLWELCKEKYPKKQGPHLGLNVIVSDGRSLHAMCFYPPGSKRMSFFNPMTQKWGTMSFAKRGDRVIFASEDMDSGKWVHFRNPEIVSAIPKGNRIRIVRQAVKVPVEKQSKGGRRRTDSCFLNPN